MLSSSRIFQRSMMLLLTFTVLLLGSPGLKSQVSAATLTTSVINLTGTSNVQLKSAELFTQEKGLYLIYTLTYTNKGTSSLQLDDYWSKVKSSSGKSYSTKVADKDKKVISLGAKSSVDITYYSAVDDNTTLSTLLIDVVKWDFSAPNYFRNIGTFNLAKVNIKPTAAFQPKYLLSKESKLKTAVKGIQTSADSEIQNIDLSFLIENLNTRDFKAATMQFYIIANDGSVYSMKNDSLKDMVIQPKERKIITLKASVPSDIYKEGVNLIVGYWSEADSLFVPQARYQLPKSNSLPTSSVSVVDYGDYNIEITGYNRLPSETKDTLTATFKVTNTSKIGLKVPQLKASWTFNGIAQTASSENVVAYDQRIQLEPGSSIQMIASIEVPYTSALNDVRVNLKETVDAQTEKIVGLFKSNSFNGFQSGIDQTAEFERMAATAEVQVIRVRSSIDGKQLNVNGDLAITNLEPRMGNLQKYALYIRGENGQIFPLKVEEYTKAVIPNGKVMIPFSGKIPLSVQATNMNILVSDLIPVTAEGNGAAGAAGASLIPGMVYSLSSTWPSSTPMSKFNNISIGNVDLSFDKFYAYLDYSDMGGVQGLNLELEYSMLTDPTYDDIAGPYKLRVEIEDQGTSKVVVAKDFEFGTDKQEFKEGQAIKKTINFVDSNISNKVELYTNYKLSVYSVSNEQKVLLAQREMPYFYIQWLEFQPE